MLRPDSLSGTERTVMFSDIDTARVTKDATGAEFLLHVGARGWRGEVRVAEGQVGSYLPIGELRYDGTSHSIAITFLRGSEAVRFQGFLSCDSLWGTWEQVRGAADSGRVFHRVIRPAVGR